MPGAKEYRGAAGTLFVNTLLNAGDNVALVDGGTAGWPTGVTFPFVIVIDKGNANEEKILCSSLTGAGPSTIAISQRGYDGTTPSTHQIGAAVQHTLDADSLDTFSKHAFDTARDDHTQYLHVNGSRVPINTDAWFGDPVAVGVAIAQGILDLFARADHVHVLGNNTVGTNQILDDAVGTTEIAADAVGQSELAPLSVGTPEIIDGSVSAVKLAADSKRRVAGYSGTLDGSQNLVVTHGAGFTPSAVFLQHISPSGGANQGFPVITAIAATTFTLRYLNTAGSMAGVAVTGSFLCLP